MQLVKYRICASRLQRRWVQKELWYEQKLLLATWSLPMMH